MSSFDRFRHSCTYNHPKGTPCNRFVDLDATPSCRDCRPAWCKECLELNKEQKEKAIAQYKAKKELYERKSMLPKLLEFVKYKAKGEYERIPRPSALTCLIGYLYWKAKAVHWQDPVIPPPMPALHSLESSTLRLLWSLTNTRFFVLLPRYQRIMGSASGNQGMW